MTTLEQIQFVNELCDHLSDSLTELILSGKIPEDWNGVELRWLMSEKTSWKTSDKKRRRSYNNTVLVNNL